MSSIESVGVRVRMAPGPTGPFHIGRARTAVINWLFARHHAGTFVLRIEDTDQKRSKPEHLQSILDSFHWLGLEWDEGPEVGGPYGPYFQMGRLPSYRMYAQRLLESGKAYRCYCTAEELEAQRAQATAERRAFRYPRTCRYLSEAERQEREDRGLTHVLRLAVDTEGATSFDDLVLGAISVQNSELDDLVIVKTDGIPTYNFAVVIDDLTMRISHVIRGQDHVPNTPKQISIYRALDEPLPAFAHLPMVVNLEERKISARYGARPVNDWGNDGYLPEAIFNYLATLGISYREGEELFSRTDLIKLFELDKVGRSRSKMDQDKMDWTNAQYLRALPLLEFVRRSMPFLELRELVQTPPTPEDMDRATAALSLEQERVRTLAETPDAVEFFLRDDISYDPYLLVMKKSSAAEAGYIIDAALRIIGELDGFDHDVLDQRFRSLAQELELKTGTVFGTIRVAITGRTAAPPLFDTMLVLGREVVTARLEKASAHLAARSDNLE
ncbi:MAG: glutamate--tRNA ligase [Chloroflexota bacterium]